LGLGSGGEHCGGSWKYGGLARLLSQGSVAAAAALSFESEGESDD